MSRLRSNASRWYVCVLMHAWLLDSAQTLVVVGTLLVRCWTHGRCTLIGRKVHFDHFDWLGTTRRFIAPLVVDIRLSVCPLHCRAEWHGT